MGKESSKKLNLLLEKSRELFWKFGYSAVTMDQIAFETGISKMTIYRYFSSKEELFTEIITRDIVFHMNTIKAMIKEKYHTFEKIELLYNYSLNIAKEYPLVLLRDIMKKKSVLKKVTEVKKREALPIWQSILEDGIKKKKIRSLDLDFISELLMNLPEALKNMDFLGDQQEFVKFYDNFMDFLKFGLLGGTANKTFAQGEERGSDGENCAHDN